jgi:hypothetical protein
VIVDEPSTSKILLKGGSEPPEPVELPRVFGLLVSRQKGEMSMTIIQNKAKKQKAKPVDRATPVIRKPKGTDGEKSTVARGITSAMKGTPQWNSSPELQKAVANWNVASDALETNGKSIADARRVLEGLVATQRVTRQSWRTAAKEVTGIVNRLCEGSPDLVHSLGFDVFKHGAPAAQPAPIGLVPLPGKAVGGAEVTWQRGTATHGFVVQRAADVANPATYAAAVPCTKTKYMIEGAPSASVVHFRVAAIDPTSSTGVSPWSDWVACTVR